MKKPLIITSTEALDSSVTAVVRLKTEYASLMSARDHEITRIEKEHSPKLAALADRIRAEESTILSYCESNRTELFPDKKSRETTVATIGFEITPPRVEPANKKITQKQIIERLQRLDWGDVYIRYSDPKLNKDALLADRETLTPEQRTAAGIQFVQDEQFFIRPKLESAQLHNSNN